MDVGGINGKLNSNTIDSTRNKLSDNSFEKHMKNAVDKSNAKELKEACKEFESIFMNMLYKQMKSSIPKSELIPGDSGRDIFESMQDENLMEQASKGKGIGLADVLYKQLSKRIE